MRLTRLPIRTTDVDSNIYDEVFTISLNDLAESNNAPTDLSSGIELNTDGGNDAYLDLSDPTLFNGLDELSFEVTFSGLSNVGTQATIYSHLDPGVSSSNFSILADGTLDLNGFTTTGNYTQLFDGGMHHLAFSWDASAGIIHFFVDGEFAEAVTAPTFANFGSGGTLVLGQHIDPGDGSFDSSEAFSGTFHDLRVWDQVRSEAEISLNYQNKFDSGNLPSGLVGNWQMDGFNGSNEVVDVVSGNNLSIGHASGTGFTASTPIEDLHISENATDGTSVGFVVPSDPDVSQDIVSDGAFTEAGSAAGNPTYYADGSGAGSVLGGWTVTNESVDYIGNIDSPPLGGNAIDLAGDWPGAIEQTLTTEVGRQYQVDFFLTGNFTGGAEAVKMLRASAAGESFDFAVTQPAGWDFISNALWEGHSFTFTADSTSTDLSFASLNSDAWGALIANVRVIEIPAAVTTILNNDPTLSYDATTEKFYRVSASMTGDWYTARSVSEGSLLNGVTGSMLSIDSAYENQKFFEVAKQLNRDLWLGATDEITEGEFYWHDSTGPDDQFWTGGGGGSALAYSNWSTGVPPYGGDFVALSDDNGTWSDFANGYSRYYVTEWDASEVLSNFTFSLTDDAGGRFAIDSATGEITVADGSQLDYETDTSHNITVEVTDATGNTYSEAMTIEVNNLGGEPTQTLPAAQNVDEDSTLTFSSRQR